MDQVQIAGSTIEMAEVDPGVAAIDGERVISRVNGIAVIVGQMAQTIGETMRFKCGCKVPETVVKKMLYDGFTIADVQAIYPTVRCKKCHAAARAAGTWEPGLSLDAQGKVIT